MHIYYSAKLGRRSDVLELDYERVLFRRKPLLCGPEELLATLVMGHV